MLSIDDFNLYLNKHQIPKRIVSLCPSITETLCDLGLSKYLAGVTDFCIHPISVTEKIPKVGGPKDVSLQAIKKINPEIVLVSKEENKKTAVEQIALDYPCVVFDVKEFNEALKMIIRLGEIFACKEIAAHLVENIKRAFAELNAGDDHISYLYLIWKNPYMAASTDTYINSILSKLLFRNCVVNFEKRYPNIEQQIQQLDFDLILLPSEPYKFGEKDQNELQQMFPGRKVELVDGEMFCWYGSHMLKAAVYLKELKERIRN